MKRWIARFVSGMVVVACGVIMMPDMAASQGIKTLSDFLQLRDVLTEMQSKVPLGREWSLVYCECKNGKVVAVPVQGAATDIDRLLCERKSRDHGGCKSEARVMKVGPSEKRIEAYRKREQEEKKIRALEQEQERLWRAQQEQQASTPQSARSRPSSDTQWMSKEDYEQHKRDVAEEEYQAERKARKRRVDKLRDDAKEVIYRNILGY